MRVNLKKFRIEKTASRDETRPSLNCVYLDVDNSVLVATDGYGMAVIPVTELGLDDESGLIPSEAIAPLCEAHVLNGSAAHGLRLSPGRAQGERLGHLVPNHEIRRALFDSVQTRPNIHLFAESLAPFEMSLRGYSDANRRRSRGLHAGKAGCRHGSGGAGRERSAAMAWPRVKPDYRHYNPP